MFVNVAVSILILIGIGFFLLKVFRVSLNSSRLSGFIKSIATPKGGTTEEIESALHDAQTDVSDRMSENTVDMEAMRAENKRLKKL